jgi:eukaryotic-like serine/threonine-protein kinase
MPQDGVMKRYCPICRTRYPDDVRVCPADGMRLFSLEDPLIGKLVDGRYRVTEKLGAGGMGAVYKIREEHTGRVEAMKVLSPGLAGDAVQRARFLREARAAKHIDHENIIKVRETGETEDGVVYMVMDYLAGPTLADLIASGPLPFAKAVAVMIQVARGLGRAHDLGIVHRDIKPDNIILEPVEDGEGRVKILDFGLARMKGDMRLTQTGQVFGTPEYVSPEQATGGTASPASDLYGVGIMFYETLVGHLPFEGAATQVMLSHLNREPIPPSRAGGPLPVPPEADDVVMRLLRKRPEDRYQDAHHLLEDLTRLAAIGECQEEADEHFDTIRGITSPVAADPRGRVEPVSGIGDWRRRIARYGEAVARVPDRMHPPWLHGCHTHLATLVEEGARLDASLKKEAEARERDDESLRQGRERLGHAVDAIARDESALRREIQIAQKQAEALELGVAAARASRKDAPRESLARLKTLRRQLRDDAVRLEDLGFQLEQLRGRMAAQSAGFEHDAGTSGIRNRMDAARLEVILAELRSGSARIDKFLEGFPQLRVGD